MSYIKELVKHLLDPRVIFKYIMLWLIGGCAYIIIELLWRGHTDMTMLPVGGLCFVLCGILNQFINWEMPLSCQCIISAILITIVELISGFIINKGMGLAVWDYSNTPYNFCGQICLAFSCGWSLLSIPAIIFDDFIRWIFFNEEKPHYCIFGYKKCHCEECEKSRK